MTGSRAKADAAWNEIATKVFDTSEDEAGNIIAVLKKFIWQVKRKMRPTDHQSPGASNPGASTRRQIDFKMIEDDRNIDIWNSYILFLDEMGYASKANVDTVKHAITATNLVRRPMRTNNKVTVTQNASFIGASKGAG
jgi:hypothetical protein